MKRIGLLSDTHGIADERILRFFDRVDEIWHAGDIGNMETARQLASLKPLVAVTGNIDGKELRMEFPGKKRFLIEDTDVLITHQGGYPGHYDKSIRPELFAHPPDIFICGHSHILKIIYDERLRLLFLNPGAAGIYGFHKVMTALRFVIAGNEIREMEIWQADKKGTEPVKL